MLVECVLLTRCKLDLVEQAPTSGCLKRKVSDTGTVATHKQQVHIQVLIMWHVMNLMPTLVVKHVMILLRTNLFDGIFFSYLTATTSLIITLKH